MFERFNTSARDVVEGAVDHARRADADAITEDHLLLALLDLADTRTAFVLTVLGVDERRADLVTALAEARRRGGISRTDAAALADLGIDVAEIVARVEDTHGPGALAAARKRKWWRPSGHRPFTREAKNVLEQSLRATVARGDRYISDEHILLALATVPGLAADVLAEHGVTRADIVRVLEHDGEGRAKAG